MLPATIEEYVGEDDPVRAYDAFVEEVPSEDLIGDSEEDVNELTRRHVKITEKYIRKYPDQWLWQHKRWKHVPLEKADQGNPAG